MADTRTRCVARCREISILMFWCGALLLSASPFTACAAARVHNQVPQGQEDQAQVPGMPSSIRTWGDAMSVEFIAEMIKSRDQTIAYHKAHPDDPLPATVDILAISGGGENGAFGAGLLYGWSHAGNRPKFRLVTGISTGALIAPFAFVGSSCDEKLKDAYTTVHARDIFIVKSLMSAFGSDSLADAGPLNQMINKWVDADLLKVVAQEHAKGRRLYVATVNLDCQRQVIWDMGAIASSGDPRAPELFRNVMLASASIPVLFPPVYFKVTIDGKNYDEMHVDGGTVSQTFLWDASLTVANMGKKYGFEKTLAPVRVFVLRNGYMPPEWQMMRPRLREIAPRTVSTIIKSQAVGDLYRLYATCQRDGFEFNVAHIPNDFTMKLKTPFDNSYMNALFDVGQKLGRQGYPWIKEPWTLTATTSPSTNPATLPEK